MLWNGASGASVSRGGKSPPRTPPIQSDGPELQSPEGSEFRGEWNQHQPKTYEPIAVPRVAPVTKGAAHEPGLNEEGATTQHPKSSRRFCNIFTPVVSHVRVIL